MDRNSERSIVGSFSETLVGLNQRLVALQALGQEEEKEEEGTGTLYRFLHHSMRRHR